ncbi:unnamed protein product [Rhizoctonia solani]|uniref:Transmembrane protein n=1 Tax=Rhizoctonia solani TaxID=456999 RepID=A0A8H3CDA9_9AGAM|nr:unnamed protein product [Rhizoctonia solani]
MIVSVTMYPSLLVWHYWITILRVLNSLAGLPVLLIFLLDGWSYESTGFKAQWVFMLVMWLLVPLNDILLLTYDMKRAYPYLGCIGVQSTISLASFIFSTVSSIRVFTRDLAADGYHPGSSFIITLGILSTIYSFTSASSLGLIIWPVASLRNRQEMAWAEVWNCNTKDAFFIHSGESNWYHPGMAENVQRGAMSNRHMIRIIVNGLRRAFTRLLFRRVHPVERKSYAFARNMFAALAMCMIVFRAITALVKTKNKVDTKVYSKNCEPIYYEREHDVQVLMLFHSTGEGEGGLKIQAEVSIEASQGTVKPCNQTQLSTYGGGWYPYTLLSYACNSSVRFDWNFKPLSYLITANSSSQSPLKYEDMPLVWLSNKKEITLDKKVVPPFYSTPWRPLPGHHSEIEAGLVSRGFMSSSMVRDLVLNKDPEYTYISLYPIVTLAATPLSNPTITTARLHLTMRPGLNHLRDRESFDKVNSNEEYPLVESWADGRACDFIEDYRSGTILDVLGSVGGLFAILQTLHILLFGRPLLWGLSGAKLINPFGIVGAFDTEDFNRRVREVYGREPTKDNPDTIQTAAFLRDFVIDMGPLATEEKQNQEPVALQSTVDRQGTPINTVPLMSVDRMNRVEHVLEDETITDLNLPEGCKQSDSS